MKLIVGIVATTHDRSAIQRHHEPTFLTVLIYFHVQNDRTIICIQSERSSRKRPKERIISRFFMHLQQQHAPIRNFSFSKKKV